MVCLVLLLFAASIVFYYWTGGNWLISSNFFQHHLGSTTALTDSKGALVERETYDAYGNSIGSMRTRYGYTGRERDSLTGLMYYRARFYDPQLGRFISEDPIGLTGGINSFAYVSNNPQNRTDPSGLYEIDVHYSASAISPDSTYFTRLPCLITTSTFCSRLMCRSTSPRAAMMSAYLPSLTVPT